MKDDSLSAFSVMEANGRGEGYVHENFLLPQVVQGRAVEWAWSLSSDSTSFSTPRPAALDQLLDLSGTPVSNWYKENR